MTIRAQIQSVLLAGEQHGGLVDVSDDAGMRELGHPTEEAGVCRDVVRLWELGQDIPVDESAIDGGLGILDVVWDGVVIVVGAVAINAGGYPAVGPSSQSPSFCFYTGEGLLPEGAGLEQSLFPDFGPEVDFLVNRQPDLDAIRTS